MDWLRSRAEITGQYSSALWGETAAREPLYILKKRSSSSTGNDSTTGVYPESNKITTNQRNYEEKVN